MSTESVIGLSRRSVVFGGTAAAMAVAVDCPAVEQQKAGAEEAVGAATQALADVMQMVSGGKWSSKIDNEYILVFKDFGLGTS